MSSASPQGPYRDPAERPKEPAPPPPREPFRWKSLGLSIMASAGINVAALLLVALALNFERGETVWGAELREAIALCILVAGLGGTIAACAELRGDP